MRIHAVAATLVAASVVAACANGATYTSRVDAVSRGGAGGLMAYDRYAMDLPFVIYAKPGVPRAEYDADVAECERRADAASEDEAAVEAAYADVGYGEGWTGFVQQMDQTGSPSARNLRLGVMKAEYFKTVRDECLVGLGYAPVTLGAEDSKSFRLLMTLEDDEKKIADSLYPEVSAERAMEAAEAATPDSTTTP